MKITDFTQSKIFISYVLSYCRCL